MRAGGGRRARWDTAWRVPLACAALALVGGVDAVFARRREPPLPVAALLDEAAHVATAALCLGAVRPGAPPPFVAGAVLGAVLIDADHLPGRLGWDVLATATERPCTHAAATALAALLLAGRSGGARRELALGAACGLATHLARDTATGGDAGVPFLWPLTPRRLVLPYGLYAALLLLAWGAIARRGTGAGQPSPSM
ncbi:MAG TPA: metal-dependent hydrolase [Thermomicrobiales bacterium]|nr:metal-dependent hydrolase [Thermomicrobiales bacterium]